MHAAQCNKRGKPGDVAQTLYENVKRDDHQYYQDKYDKHSVILDVAQAFPPCGADKCEVCNRVNKQHGKERNEGSSGRILYVYSRLHREARRDSKVVREQELEKLSSSACKVLYGIACARAEQCLPYGGLVEGHGYGNQRHKNDY